jgi:hypothetical protein
LDQIRQRSGSTAPGGRRLCERFGSAIVGRHVVPGLLQAGHHVQAHLSKTDESDFHDTPSTGGEL